MSESKKTPRKRIERAEIKGDYNFWCNLRDFQTSSIICKHRKETRRRGCCGCRQIVFLEDGTCQLDKRSLKPVKAKAV